MHPLGVAAKGPSWYLVAATETGLRTFRIDRIPLTDEQNDILAPSFTTWAAGIGYRTSHCELRLDGLNLNDSRQTVSLSELGDGQYYIMPARSFRLTLSTRF